MSVSTYDFDLDKQVIFNYKETDLPEGHFLHKFLIEFQIEKFEIIETESSALDLESKEVSFPKKQKIRRRKDRTEGNIKNISKGKQRS